MSRPPTIFDVAEATGLSITTVSHVFSGRRPVSEKTRQRVLETTEQLGYQPHRPAQALARGRTMTLALQISLSSTEVVLSPYYAEMIPALSEAALALGYSFVVVPPNPGRESFVAPLLDHRTIDGAIVIDPRRGEPFVNGLVEASVPFVTSGRLLDVDVEIPAVDSDHDQICADTLAHLKEQSYESVTMISYPSDTSYPLAITESFRRRSPEGRIVVADGLTERAGYAAAHRALDDDCDGLFCISDVLALGAMAAARDRHRQVPESLGIVGVGDGFIVDHTTPPLSSTRVFPAKMGELLVSVLDDVLSGADPPAVSLTPTELIRRGSTSRLTPATEETPEVHA